MTPHISAQIGDIAQSILLPGDPLRAKWIAETFLKDPVCFNEVRGMLGFTGSYNGQKISVMGTGMGMPSLSIYVHELLDIYGVKTLIRVGSCGAIGDGLGLLDVIICSAASTDSAINRQKFGNIAYAPVANFYLLREAVRLAEERNIRHTVGPIMSGDQFYIDDTSHLAKVKSHGVLGIEMEAAALYTLAAKFNAQALGIMTVSDIIGETKELSSKEREQSMRDMCLIALDTVCQSTSSLD
ncbi:MAG: purine-nucleoside phosphorylase [Hyphomicrobiales bacterium]|nr:purine-nucleoside phosphorylase [Hyphomicrobiales bacterium]